MSRLGRGPRDSTLTRDGTACNAVTCPSIEGNKNVGALIIIICIVIALRIAIPLCYKNRRTTKAERLGIVAPDARRKPKDEVDADGLDGDGWVLVPKRRRWIERRENRVFLFLCFIICVCIGVALWTLKKYRFIA